MNYRISVNLPILISSFIHENSLSVSLPCGGNGRCGRCRIKIHGDISPVTERERLFLTEKELSENIRLACFTYVNSECYIEVADENVPSPCADSAVIDIGTTTIEAKYSDGTEIKLKNPQISYGADVITRISSDKREHLHKCIKDLITKLIKNCAHAVISGNTTMLSLLTGKSTDGIAKYPFKPESLFGYSEKIGNTDVYYPPCAGAFIGADIICGVISQISTPSPAILCDIGTNTEIALYNGKDYLFSSAPSGPAFEGGNITCGSSAVPGAIYKVYAENKNLKFETIDDAPPTSICGSGLIDAIAFMQTSGIIDKTGRIMEYGHRYPHLISYIRNEIAFNISNVFITQSDIRALQTAKSAVLSALKILYERSGLDTMPPIILGGNFGNHLNTENAVKIGMLPECTFIKAPESVISGAEMLTDDTFKRRAENIAAKAVIYELALEENFADIFAENMNF